MVVCFEMHQDRTISEEICRIGQWRGATAVGMASTSRLPRVPSADAEYLLPGARSLVSTMVHYDSDIVARYLAKEECEELQRHETDLYRRLHEIARAVARLLRRSGYEAATTQPNLDYRYKDKPAYRWVPHPVKQRLVDWLATDMPLAPAKQALVPLLYRGPLRVAGWRLVPSFSHRYGAVAAGLGLLGWSGNVLHPDHGARVLYTTVLTNAELPSDTMLQDGLCDGCRLCTRSCQSGYMHPSEADTIEIGGRTFEHNRKASNLRCILVCGGFSGQSRHKDWSTWCRGRVEIPDDDARLQDTWDQLMRTSLGRDNHASRAFANLAHHAEYGFVRKPEDRFQTTCGYCQFVCAPDRGQRDRLYEGITKGS